MRTLLVLLVLLVLFAACPSAGPPVRGPSRPARPLEPALRVRADDGLRAVRGGDARSGREQLLAVLERAEGEERIAILAALAEAERQLGDRDAAARHAIELHELSDRPAERALAEQILESVGRVEEAARLRRGPGAEPGASALPALGLLVPTTGTYQLAGRDVLTGAVAGAGLLDGDGALRLLIEDDSVDAAGAARSLLARGALALIGGPARPELARAEADAAQRASAPLLTAACGEAIAPSALCLLPTGASRARALAEQGLRSGARRFALLAPRTAYGRAMSGHFAAEVRQAGGTIVVELTYPTGTASFAAEAKTLAARDLEALFVPDSAAVLSLVGPALAGAGLSSGSRPLARGAKRQLVLLATADGLTADGLSASMRHLQGAALAPGFVALPASGARLRRLEAELGQPPSLLQAYAADATTALRAALESGIRERAALLARLRQGDLEGVTGPMRFAPDGTRASPVLLYRVEGSRLRPLR